MSAQHPKIVEPDAIAPCIFMFAKQNVYET